MIYTITLNPALDYYMDFSDQKMNKWMKTNKTELMFGGKGINASVLLTRLGTKNKTIVFSGGMTGKILDGLMKKENLDIVGFDSFNDTRINIKSQFDDTYEWGTNSTNDNPGIMKELTSYLNENLTGDDILMVMGSSMLNIGDSPVKKILKIANSKNCKIVLDITEKDNLGIYQKYKPFLIKPNVKELGDMFDVVISSEEEIKKYGNKIIDMGVEFVIISDADKGAYLFSKDKLIFMDSYKINFINGSGSGDSMLAGFMDAYIKTQNPIKSLMFSIACGAGTASSQAITTKKGVYKLLEKEKNERIIK